jgi:hypothetical protein
MINKKIHRTAFNERLSKLMVVDKQTFARIGGSLRKAGMVSVGGRGPNAPHITPEDAKNILLGVMGTDNASRAAEAAKNFSELKSASGEKLGDAITQIFKGTRKYSGLACISVYRNFPKAIICWTVEKENREANEVSHENVIEEIFEAEGSGPEPAFLIEATLKGNPLTTEINLLDWLEKIEDQVIK